MNTAFISTSPAITLQARLSEYAFPPLLGARLADEQRWTPAFTARVLSEYRRFLLLAATSERGHAQQNGGRGLARAPDPDPRLLGAAVRRGTAKARSSRGCRGGGRCRPAGSVPVHPRPVHGNLWPNATGRPVAGPPVGAASGSEARCEDSARPSSGTVSGVHGVGGGRLSDLAHGGPADRGWAGRAGAAVWAKKGKPRDIAGRRHTDSVAWMFLSADSGSSDSGCSGGDGGGSSCGSGCGSG